MPSVSLKVRFEITVSDSVYYLNMTASNGSNIPTEIFLYKKSDNTFVGICLVEDLYKWPTSPQQDKPYYRASTATYSNPDPLKISAEKTNATDSIRRLVNEYAIASNIVGAEEITFRSE